MRDRDRRSVPGLAIKNATRTEPKPNGLPGMGLNSTTKRAILKELGFTESQERKDVYERIVGSTTLQIDVHRSHWMDSRKMREGLTKVIEAAVSIK